MVSKEQGPAMKASSTESRLICDSLMRIRALVFVIVESALCVGAARVVGAIYAPPPPPPGELVPALKAPPAAAERKSGKAWWWWRTVRAASPETHEPLLSE